MKQTTIDGAITTGTTAAAGSIYFGLPLADWAAITTIAASLIGAVIMIVRFVWAAKDRR